MSLIVLCGHPCSGKTTVCQKLAQRFQPFYSTVTVINPETTLGRDKNDAYRGLGVYLEGRVFLRWERCVGR